MPNANSLARLFIATRHYTRGDTPKALASELLSLLADS
jgi:hypothetical protein